MKKQKKIIFSSFDDRKNPCYGGGGAYAVHEIAKRLAFHNEVTVLTGSYPGARDEKSDGVNYKRIGSYKLGMRTGQLIFQALLPFHVMKMDYDVWIENFTPPVSVAFLPFFTRRPVVGLANLLAAKDMTKKYWGLPFYRVENFGLKFYKDVIVLTDYLKRKLEKSYPRQRFITIPNGVEEKYINHKVVNKPDGNILFLGRIDIEQKGIDILLDAFKLIEGKTDKKLVIAGSGPEKEVNWLNKRITDLGLQEKVILTGWVSGKKKLQILESAAFMVLPSRFEEFGIVVLESFCFETPVIAFDLPHLSWIPKGGVIKVKPENTKELAIAMLSLLKNDKKRRLMGKEAKKSVKKYSWSRASGLYEAVLRTVSVEKNKITTTLIQNMVK